MLTEREWLTAENLGENYWLYIVTEAKTNPEIHIIRDPVRNLPEELILQHARYHVTAEAWQKAKR